MKAPLNTTWNPTNVNETGPSSVVEFPPVTPTFPESQWSLTAVLAHQASTRGDKVFLRWMPDNSSVTFAQAQRRASELAAGFQAAGVGKGDRVVFFLGNSTDHIFAWFGLAMLGAVDAPVNTAYMGELLVHQMNLVAARYLVIDAEFLDRVMAVGDRLTALETIFVRGEMLPDVTCGRFRVIRFDTLYGELLASAPAVAMTDPATILYTSGTTGPSKGVVLCHSQLYFFAEQAVQLHRMSADDVVLAPVPLFHASGRIFGTLTALLTGATYAMYEKFSGSHFVERLHETSATVVHLLGAMMYMIHSQPPSALDRGHRLRSVFAGPTAYDIADAFAVRFGVEQIVEGLGQTEVCQPVLSPPGIRRPHGAVGVVMSQFFEAKVVDPDTDEEVPVGMVGEYVIRPKRPWLITLGYERMPEETLKAMRNLWFHTGDAVRRDADGWFYFVDRLKDCIRRRGENVSSYEVETVILTYPGVREAAAYAVKADAGDSEDEIMVSVVGDPAQIAFDTLVRWAGERLPAFAVPRYYRFVEQLPKTANDKVRKSVLRGDGITPDTYDRMNVDGNAGLARVR